MSWSGSWSAWTSLGGIAQRDPAVVDLAPGTINGFVEGTDGALWYFPIP
jgi:hypothetical protein